MVTPSRVAARKKRMELMKDFANLLSFGNCRPAMTGCWGTTSIPAREVVRQWCVLEGGNCFVMASNERENK